MDIKIIRKKLTTFLCRNLCIYICVNNIKPFFHKNKENYSDFNEDILIYEILGNNDISYIDIGAGHPIIGRNTYYFYKKVVLV
jgi:hypothetical protein